jgi:hypothetical protein
MTVILHVVEQVESERRVVVEVKVEIRLVVVEEVQLELVVLVVVEQCSSCCDRNHLASRTLRLSVLLRDHFVLHLIP